MLIDRSQAIEVLGSIRWNDRGFGVKELRPRANTINALVQERILSQYKPLTVVGFLSNPGFFQKCRDAGIQHAALEPGAIKLDVVQLVADIFEAVGIEIPTRAVREMNRDQLLQRIDDEFMSADYHYRHPGAPWLFRENDDGNPERLNYPDICIGNAGGVRIELRGLDAAIMCDLLDSFPCKNKFFDERQGWQR